MLLEKPLLPKHKHFLTNPHVWYRHPYCRIFIAFMVLFMDFVTYGEDPIIDSFVRYNSVGTGQIVGLLAIWYAPTWKYKLEKVSCLVVALILGCFIGKVFQWLMIRVKLVAFKSDGGLVASIAIGYTIACFIVDEIYNAQLGKEPARYQIDSHSVEFFRRVFFLKGLAYADLGMMWQCTSSAADWLAIFQLLDCIFQDKKHWPDFFPRAKSFYTEAANGKFRKMCFWLGCPCLVVLTAIALYNTGNEPGEFTWQIDLFGGSSEVRRSIFAGIITFQDLFFLVQDWEFPLFTETHLEHGQQTNLAGTDSNSMSFCKLSISAKWLQYGPMLLVALFDLLYLKSALTYTPEMYGQYVDPSDSRIWVITDKALLDEVYPLGVNRDPDLLNQISYAARRDASGVCLSTVPSCATDIKTLSKYSESSMEFVGLAIGICSVTWFLATLYFATKQAIKEEHPFLAVVSETNKVEPE